jgi:hypothetical protein
MKMRKLTREESNAVRVQYVIQGRAAVPAGYVERTIHKNGLVATFAYQNVEGVLYIAVQGSVERSDWISNAKFHKVKFGTYDCKVHRGFKSEFAIVRDVMDDLIKRVKKNGDKIMFVGYSRGGGTAQLLAYHYEEPLLTIAATDAGNGKFAAGLKRGTTHVAIEHRRDIVPKLTRYIYGYRDSSSERLLVGKRRWWQLRGKKNHSIEVGYIPNLNKYLQ